MKLLLSFHLLCGLHRRDVYATTNCLNIRYEEHFYVYTHTQQGYTCALICTLVDHSRTLSVCYPGVPVRLSISALIPSSPLFRPLAISDDRQDGYDLIAHGSLCSVLNQLLSSLSWKDITGLVRDGSALDRASVISIVYQPLHYPWIIFCRNSSSKKFSSYSSFCTSENSFDYAHRLDLHVKTVSYALDISYTEEQMWHWHCGIT